MIDLLFAWSLKRKCEGIEGGLPSDVMLRMTFNIAVDFMVGLIPFVGDLADAAFKCNTKNAALLEDYLMKKHGPKNMSMEEKKKSRLEDFGNNEKQPSRPLDHDQTTDLPNRPEPTQPSQQSAGGKLFGFNRGRAPDVEMGGQQTGKTRA